MIGLGRQAKKFAERSSKTVAMTLFLLQDLLAMLETNDPKDAILFGFDVTPASLLSMIGSLAVGLFMLLSRLENLGVLDTGIHCNVESFRGGLRGAF